jgi:hypothetical protein
MYPLVSAQLCFEEGNKVVENTKLVGLLGVTTARLSVCSY